MVSFWPWKADDTSPASFEKALSLLSAKIIKASSRLDSLRQRSRRYSVLWTLYAGFAYLLCTVILVLVVGWRNWSLAEHTGIVIGPVLIYVVRFALTTFYDYRISSVQARLDDLEKQRSQTITKLKAATKYDSTQELLKKYGGTPTPKNKPIKSPDGKGTYQQPSKAEPQQGGRASFVPPPTANIPGRIQAPPIGMPQHYPQQSPSPQSLLPRLISPQSPGEEFAPNAFVAPPQYSQANESSRWYDRFMDVLLGDDESLPAKRLALICRECRLVNGQAPPGVKHVEDVGKWRCGGCGALNGEENEVRKMVASIKSEASADSGVQPAKPTRAKSSSVTESDRESDVTQYSTEGEEEDGKEDIDEVAVAEKPVGEAEKPRRRSARVKKSTTEDN